MRNEKRIPPDAGFDLNDFNLSPTKRAFYRSTSENLNT